MRKLGPYLFIFVSLIIIPGFVYGKSLDSSEPNIHTNEEKTTDFFLCGKRPKFRIVGGLTTRPEIWPWIVNIRTSWGPAFCGGTIISDRFILTAAHCAWPFRRPILQKLLFIAPSIYERDRGFSKDFYKVDNIIVHQNYTLGGRFFNDIALIKLSEETKLIPACLPKTNSRFSTGRSEILNFKNHDLTAHDNIFPERLVNAFLSLLSTLSYTWNKIPAIIQYNNLAVKQNNETTQSPVTDFVNTVINSFYCKNCTSESTITLSTESFNTTKWPTTTQSERAYTLESAMDSTTVVSNNITGTDWTTTDDLPISRTTLPLNIVNSTTEISSTTLNDNLLRSSVNETSLNDQENTNELPVEAIILGWGRIKESGPTSDLLLRADIYILEDSICESAYGKRFSKDIMICAGTTEGGIDACQGDSGGPLLVRSVDRLWTLAGVVSFGVGCGSKEYPGVYTNVQHYLSWIHKNIQELTD